MSTSYMVYIKIKEMAKQRGKIGKYNKVSMQKKYELLKIVASGNPNIKEVRWFSI